MLRKGAFAYGISGIAHCEGTKAWIGDNKKDATRSIWGLPKLKGWAPPKEGTN